MATEVIFLELKVKYKHQLVSQYFFSGFSWFPLKNIFLAEIIFAWRDHLIFFKLKSLVTLDKL